MDLFDDLRWRGLVYQWTGGEQLQRRLRDERIVLYCGYDPSSDSLHIGNLVSLTLLRRFQRAGHRPIAVAGGGTGMIGDPSGKSEERQLLSTEQVEANLAAIRRQIERFLDFGGPQGALLVNNAEWLAQWSYVDFLREVGKHFPVNVMLGRESVQGRLEAEAGLSYTEFSYMLLQAYDFVHLNERFGCVLQVGGADQYGNIVAGVELARRMRGVELFGLTTPLITDSQGQKFGKTAAGTAAWLSADRTSPYALYQFFFNTADPDAGPFLRFFTELPHDEIEGLERLTKDEPHRREAQRRLARELTALVYGADRLRQAERATEALFGGALEGLGEGLLLEIFADVPSKELPRARIADGGLTAVDAFVEAGLARSRSEALRLLDGGGGYVGNRRISSSEEILGPADLASETVMVLRSGKRTFALLRFTA